MGMEDFNSGKQKTPADNTKEEIKPFFGKKTVNGIEIMVRWDEDYDNYVIHIPQIEVGENSYSYGVYQNVEAINKNPEIAKKVFEFVCQIAEKESNVYKVFQLAEEYMRSLPQEE